MKIKYKSIKEQENTAGYTYDLDESIVDYVHVLIPANNDYTLCGMATHEYKHDILPNNTKVTCKKCIQHIKECKEINLN